MENARALKERREAFGALDEEMKEVDLEERIRRGNYTWEVKFYKAVAHRARQIATQAKRMREWSKYRSGPAPEGPYLYSAKRIRECRLHKACAAVQAEMELRNRRTLNTTPEPHTADNESITDLRGIE
jgi:hypothetical protein